MYFRLPLLRAVLGFGAILIGAAAFSPPASATTYYVRPDGGPASQCNGKANAPASKAPNCAWASPTVALPMGTGNYGYVMPKPLIKGGDTLVIASGSYLVGYSSSPIAGTQGQACNQTSPGECSIVNIPSGIDASHPTVITGASCSAKPELWGSQRNGALFSLSGKHDIKIACIEITDHSNCIVYYNPNSAYECNRDSYPYGEWASTGIYASDVTNLTLQGVDIHGMANYGLMAGGLSGNTVLDDVTIRANGWGGFNGDLGNDSSSNSGTITIENSSIEWNGCTEDYPKTTIINCWAQQEGGYGDGLGTATTGGNWRIINTKFIANTSDGLDLLYADGTGSIYIDRVVSKWNAGNQIKASGPITLQNSVVDGDCAYLKGWGAMSDGDLCRASGAALALDVTAANQTIHVLYNTVTGSGDCLINGGARNFSSPDKSDVYRYENNIFLGAYYWRAGRNACLDWYTDASSIPYTVTYVNNIVWAVKANRCPSGSICKDPLLVNENPATFNPKLLPSSPAINNANKSYTVAYDNLNNSRPVGAGYDIGAIEYMGQPWLTPDQPPIPSSGTGQQGAVPKPGDAQPLPSNVSDGSGLIRPPVPGSRAGLAAGGNREAWVGRPGSVPWRVTKWTEAPAAAVAPRRAGTSRQSTVASVPPRPQAHPAAVPGQATQAAAVKPQAQTRSYFAILVNWVSDTYDRIFRR